MLLADEILTEPAHWVAGSPPAADFRCTVKLRYRQDDQPCATSVLEDGRCRVRLMTPQRAVTPGQSAVFYDGEVCLGGAVIASTSLRGTSAVVRSA